MDHKEEMEQALRAHFEPAKAKRGSVAAAGGTKILSVSPELDGVQVTVEVNGVIKAVKMPHPRRGYVTPEWARELEALL